MVGSFYSYTDYEPKVIPYYQCGMNDKEIAQRKKNKNKCILYWGFML